MEREEVKNIADGGGLERRLERAWCVLGNGVLGRSFSREGSGPVEGLSGRAKECSVTAFDRHAEDF